MPEKYKGLSVNQLINTPTATKPKVETIVKVRVLTGADSDIVKNLMDQVPFKKTLATSTGVAIKSASKAIVVDRTAVPTNTDTTAAPTTTKDQTVGAEIIRRDNIILFDVPSTQLCYIESESTFESVLPCHVHSATLLCVHCHLCLLPECWERCPKYIIETYCAPQGVVS